MLELHNEHNVHVHHAMMPTLAYTQSSSYHSDNILLPSPMQIHVKQKTKKKKNGNLNLHTFANLHDNLITLLQQFIQNLMNRATYCYCWSCS